MISIEGIKKLKDELGPGPSLSEIKVMKSSLIKDGQPILMLSPKDYEEFCKKTDKAPASSVVREGSGHYTPPSSLFRFGLI